jgi:hypothetical protein
MVRIPQPSFPIWFASREGIVTEGDFPSNFRLWFSWDAACLPQITIKQADLTVGAASTDRRNTLCEPLRWGLILQGLARPLIQLSRDGAMLRFFGLLNSNRHRSE